MLVHVVSPGAAGDRLHCAACDTITFPGPNQVRVVGGGEDETLTNVEVLQFNNGAEYYLVGGGTQAVPVDISGVFLPGAGGLTSLTGATDDFVTINGGAYFNRTIDLGGGTGDTLNLTSGGTLTLTGIEQINIALNQMDEVTQQNSALVEENAATAKTLEQQAGAMDESIAIFKIDATAAKSAIREPAGRPRHERPAARMPARAAVPKKQVAAAPAAAVAARRGGGGAIAALKSEQDWKEF